MKKTLNEKEQNVLQYGQLLECFAKEDVKEFIKNLELLSYKIGKNKVVDWQDIIDEAGAELTK